MQNEKTNLFLITQQNKFKQQQKSSSQKLLKHNKKKNSDQFPQIQTLEKFININTKTSNSFQKQNQCISNELSLFKNSYQKAFKENRLNKENCSYDVNNNVQYKKLKIDTDLKNFLLKKNKLKIVSKKHMYYLMNLSKDVNEYLEKKVFKNNNKKILQLNKKFKDKLFKYDEAIYYFYPQNLECNFVLCMIKRHHNRI